MGAFVGSERTAKVRYVSRASSISHALGKQLTKVVHHVLDRQHPSQ
jgi:hypothetical protein